MGLLVSSYQANPITNNSLAINSVSGSLQKTFRKSYFYQFQLGSRQEDIIFDKENPRLGVKYDNYYNKWENFHKVIKRAKIACETSNNNINDHFPEFRKPIVGDDRTPIIKIDDLLEILNNQPDYKSAWEEEFEFINSLYKGRHSKYVINVISKRQELEQKYNLESGEQHVRM